MPMKTKTAVLQKSLLALFVVALLVAFGWVATHSGPLAPIKVSVTKVIKSTISPSLPGIGTLEARRDYLVGPIVAGRVLRVLVDVGDKVKAGQLLAEMDPVDLDARVASNIAAVARAQSQVSSAQALAEETAGRLHLATVEANRYSELGKQRLVSSSIVDVKRQEQKTAEAQLAAAKANLQAAQKEQVRIEADQTGLEQQRANVRLLAPADGVITARDAEPGSTVVAGQSVVRLMEPSSLWIKVRFDQARSTGLELELPAEIKLRSQQGQHYTGKVARIELLSDSVTEERLAHVTFDRLPEGASIGEMADLKIKLPTRKDVLVIPNASLRLRGDQLGVWVYEKNSLRFANITPGSESPDGLVEVVSGLNENYEVVVYSEQDVSENSRISVTTSSQQSK